MIVFLGVVIGTIVVAMYPAHLQARSGGIGAHLQALFAQEPGCS